MINIKKQNKYEKSTKTVVKRVPKKLVGKIEKRGGGDFRRGLYRMDKLTRLAERDPSQILNSILEEYTALIEGLASDNHYEHFVDSRLPVVLRKFNKTGRVDFSFISDEENDGEGD